MAQWYVCIDPNCDTGHDPMQSPGRFYELTPMSGSARMHTTDTQEEFK